MSVKNPALTPNADLVVYGVPMTRTPQVEAIMTSDLHRELWFFAHRNDTDVASVCNSPGVYFHCRNVIDMIWNQKGREKLKWWDGLEASLEEFCTTDEVLITGPGSYSKTFAASLYAMVFWMCDPLRSGVLCCSTTLPGLKRRLWGEIRTLYMSARPIIRTGNLVDSLTALQTEKGNMIRGLFGIAVAEGEESKALGRIIGFHPPRLLVIVDELTDVGWAIVEALVNLFGAKEKAQFIGLGNAANIFDSHGKMCEPEAGWNTVSVESEQWKTKRGGVCLHYDAMKSPNVIAGRKVFDFLPTQEDIDKTSRDFGENSPQMWRFRRGFWCPEGTVKSILSGQMLSMHRAFDKAEWLDTKIRLAALDPAFEGGDRCVLRFGTVGKEASGTDVLQLEPPITLKPNMTLPRPLHYQLADQIKEACQKEGVGPENFAMDTTGEGGGLASIIAEEWGPGFHQVEFGGKASDQPVSMTDHREGHEVYKNRVTELWFTFRVLVIANQIRGLDAETATEFCNRLYEVADKIVLETKAKMKERYRKSPDFADAAAVCTDLARVRGYLGKAPTRLRSTVARNWQTLINEFTLDDEEAFQHDGMVNI